MQQTYDNNNPLITLSESHRKLSFRALEFILVAWVISMLLDGKDIINIPSLRYVIIIDLLGPIISSAIYRRAARGYQESDTQDEKSAQSAYSHAKTLQYNILAGVIYATCLAIVCSQAQWLAFAAFLIWMVLFLQIPRQTEIDRDFAYEKEAETEFM